MDIKPEFGYVVGVVAAAALVHTYMGMAVVGARKKYGVKYPDMYADKDNCPCEADRKVFNCVQRGHQNSLENLPTFYALLITTGLKYPITASGCGVLYLIGRYLYFKGYATGVPNKRYDGRIGYLGLLGLLGTAIKMVGDAVMAQVAK